MSIFDGVSRPARVAGISLLGVAVVTAVIGTATALTGGESEQSATPTTSAPAPGQPGQPSGAPAPPAPEPGAPPAQGPGGPQASPPEQGPGGSAGSVESEPGGTGDSGSGPVAQQGGAGSDQQVHSQQAAAKWVNVRVYNNSTIHGLAARAAQDFRKQGWNVGESGNYPSGLIPSTTAYYRPGTDEETAGKALASSFGMRAEPRFEGIADSSPGLIVIVTNDYKGAVGKTG